MPDPQAVVVEPPVVTAPPLPVRDTTGRFAGVPDDLSTKEGARKAFGKLMDADRKKAPAELPTERVLGTPPEKTEQPQEPAKPVEPKAPAVDETAVNEGKLALKRLNVPDRILSAMTPAEIAEHGKAAKAQVTELDNLHREIGELRKRPKEIAVQPKESAPAEQPFDYAKAVQPFASVLDEDSGKALANVIKDVREPLIAELKALKQELAESLGPIRAESAHRELTAARNKLGESIPELADDSHWNEAVWPEMQKRDAWIDSTTGKPVYQDMQALIRDSALAVSTNVPAAKASPSPSAASAKRNGLPSDATEKPRPAAPTDKEKARALFSKVTRVRSEDELERLAGGV